MITSPKSYSYVTCYINLLIYTGIYFGHQTIQQLGLQYRVMTLVYLVLDLNKCVFRVVCGTFVFDGRAWFPVVSPVSLDQQRVLSIS